MLGDNGHVRGVGPAEIQESQVCFPADRPSSAVQLFTQQTPAGLVYLPSSRLVDDACTNLDIFSSDHRLRLYPW